MKVYVFEWLDTVSDRFHSDGGAVIVAKDLREAKKLVEAEPHLIIPNWKEATVYKLDGEYKPCVYIFPDAGCC